MQLWNYTNLTNENKPFIKCNFIGKNGHSLLNMPLAPVKYQSKLAYLFRSVCACVTKSCTVCASTTFLDSQYIIFKKKKKIISYSGADES